jgi:hypothetical protein
VNEEQTWVLQAQQGDDEAFTRLVETYQTPVFNLCYRMLGEPESAEDAAQETFLRAYQHLQPLRPANARLPRGCFPSPRITASTACAAANSPCSRWTRRTTRATPSNIPMPMPPTPKRNPSKDKRRSACMSSERPRQHRPRRSHYEILVRLFRKGNRRVVAAHGQRGQEPPAPRPQGTGWHVAGSGRRPARRNGKETS